MVIEVRIDCPGERSFWLVGDIRLEMFLISDLYVYASYMGMFTVKIPDVHGILFHITSAYLYFLEGK